MTPSEYVQAYLITSLNGAAFGYTIGGGAGAAVPGPGKVAPKVDDIPADIERGATPSSYAGVRQRDGAWEARVGRTVLGRFSSPEVAALARYYAIVGYKTGRGAFYEDVHMMPEYAARKIVDDAARFAPLTPDQKIAGASARGDVAAQARLAADVEAQAAAGLRRVGPGRGGHPQPRGAVESGVLVTQEDDPSEGPETSEGPRETSADDERTPTTAIRDATSAGGEGQADPRAFSGRGRRRRAVAARCPICTGDMTPGIARAHDRFCLLCSDDYTTWLGLPDEEDIGVPDEFTSGHVIAPEDRAFAAYVHRTRGL